MWKSLDEFEASHAADREIIESILEGALEKYRIDATQFSIKVPDLLLRECEQELQRVRVQPAGPLSIVHFGSNSGNRCHIINIFVASSNNHRCRRHRELNWLINKPVSYLTNSAGKADLQ